MIGYASTSLYPYADDLRHLATQALISDGVAKEYSMDDLIRYWGGRKNPRFLNQNVTPEKQSELAGKWLTTGQFVGVMAPNIGEDRSGNAADLMTRAKATSRVGQMLREVTV